MGVGPVSRKIPRLDSRVEESCDIDRFIEGPPLPVIHITNPMNKNTAGDFTRPSPFPDQNSQLLSKPLEEYGNSLSNGSIPDACEQLVECGGNQNDNRRPAEVDATINTGKEFGVNLDNLEELVRTVIEGEMET
ncbi:hypothetical protein L1987_27913 [Smallanthus sonchifolius]|uniref:Uncharacterized protein n=1 Tax=Smallanthus sonchifolius TaxID=185202 RepID=A0ACB9ICD2_9ASTR|nr:hypothetical protein L1987_27913 [Smallanthus sonchifolius]